MIVHADSGPTGTPAAKFKPEIVFYGKAEATKMLLAKHFCHAKHFHRNWSCQNGFARFLFYLLSKQVYCSFGE